MKQHIWTSKEKFEIVLEGLRGDTTLAEVCNRYGISQNHYYKWRDKLFESGEQIFARGGFNREGERLKDENLRLRGIIGDLTVELKKTLR
jgi:transposase-like protein